MHLTDWIILLLVLIGIIIYGVWKGRGQDGADTYIKAGSNLPWHVVLLGIMATQASAITFLSGPGQAYTDGMRFIQYYLGLPLAMIVISAVFVPIFQKLGVYTAYEYLETRFDKKTRVFAGILFLFSRGVSTGVSIYAPAIILSTLFNWNIFITNILIGGALIIYSYTGGAKAIAHTQKIQFGIILASMLITGFVIVYQLPNGMSFNDALYLAGKSERLNVITTQFKWDDKYNIWSGIIGGFFLALSYFGADQSQVGRYLSAKNIRESRLGLLLNGIVKIPMQFGILLIGALLFSFYLIKGAPLFFNQYASEKVAHHFPETFSYLNERHENLSSQNQHIATQLTQNNANHTLVDSLKHYNELIQNNKDSLKTLIAQNQSLLGVSDSDTNYVFLHYVQHYLPIGMVGLLFAVVFLASWGSISAALNSLASSSLMDFHQVFSKKKLSGKQELFFGRMYTLFWGIFGILVAMFATRMGSLIEAVNELGSLFYGAMLGLFLTAFFFKKIKGTAVFWGAVLAEILVLIFYLTNVVAFLWLNVIGALAVIVFAYLVQVFGNKQRN